MKIAVTHKHIFQGKLCNASYCPVALAIREAIYIRYGSEPDTIEVSVSTREIICRIATPYKMGICETPVAVKHFIRVFDTFKDQYGLRQPKIEELLEKVEPFIFELPEFV